jgi:hypothetical protein
LTSSGVRRPFLPTTWIWKKCSPSEAAVNAIDSSSGPATLACLYDRPSSVETNKIISRISARRAAGTLLTGIGTVSLSKCDTASGPWAGSNRDAITVKVPSPMISPRCAVGPWGAIPRPRLADASSPSQGCL